MKNIKDIDKKLEFLKAALRGGDFMLVAGFSTNRKESVDKIVDDNNKIQSEIDELERRKKMVIRTQKIKKITNGN